MGSQIKFGRNIRIARNKIGLTQKQVASKARVHVNYYARIERGEENPYFISSHLFLINSISKTFIKVLYTLSKTTIIPLELGAPVSSQN